MNIDWTHKKIYLRDIRKTKKFYILNVSDKSITSPLFVDHLIFEARVKSFYLRDTNKFSREEVIDQVRWNMVITKGYFIKLDKDGKAEHINKDEDKFYISFLEIDGPLGTYISN